MTVYLTDREGEPLLLHVHRCVCVLSMGVDKGEGLEQKEELRVRVCVATSSR